MSPFLVLSKFCLQISSFTILLNFPFLLGKNHGRFRNFQKTDTVWFSISTPLLNYLWLCTFIFSQNNFNDKYFLLSCRTKQLKFWKKIKFLKILHGDLLILMHQKYFEEHLNQKLQKIISLLYKKSLIVKSIRSYLSILK